jgi:hypothetical protein
VKNLEKHWQRLCAYCERHEWPRWAVYFIGFVITGHILGHKVKYTSEGDYFANMGVVVATSAIWPVILFGMVFFGVLYLLLKVAIFLVSF